MAPTLPAQAGLNREQAILDLVAQGHAQVTWAEVTSSHNGHTAVFKVFADALKIDGLRVNLTAVGEQRVADMLGCSLLTAKLADLIWQQRQVTLPPFPRPITSSTEGMVTHSQQIDQALAKLGNPAGLICTVGKHWIIDAGIPKGRAMNYGWHCNATTYKGPTETVASLFKESNGQYGRLIQGRGTAHDAAHVDYSQTVVLVHRLCIVDGEERPLSEVLTDPVLANLASHTGALKILRQPGVSETDALAPYFDLTPESTPSETPTIYDHLS